MSQDFGEQELAGGVAGAGGEFEQGKARRLRFRGAVQHKAELARGDRVSLSGGGLFPEIGQLLSVVCTHNAKSMGCRSGSNHAIGATTDESG